MLFVIESPKISVDIPTKEVEATLGLVKEVATKLENICLICFGVAPSLHNPEDEDEPPETP